MSPTIKDVARVSGVSISTVSRVMNSPEIVSAEKRKLVEKAIEKLDYRPNALARGLIYKRTHTVGVLIPDISNSYASELVKGLEDAGHEAGISLILCNTNRDRKRMIHYLNVLKQNQVDGIVFTSEFFNKEYAKIVEQMKIPIVLASTQSIAENVPCVKIDDHQAAFDAVKYLVEMGHQNIGMISGSRYDLVAGLPRYLGFKQAKQQLLGIADPDDRIQFGDFRYKDGYFAMSKLQATQLPLTAIFCASDEMALGAISFLAEQGLRVPEDLSVLGFDNTKIAEMSIPKLTTMAQPIYEIGRQAMTKLNSLRGGKKAEELCTHAPHKIVERNSVRRL